MSPHSNYLLTVLTEFDRDDISALYESVGWSIYTNDRDALIAGVRGSTRVVGATVEGVLVGLARVISDGCTIAYVQDILVHPAHQRSGLGKMLVAELLEPFEHVRQTVLLTDDEPGQRAFYESLGFTETRDFDGFQLRAFVKFSD